MGLVMLTVANVGWSSTGLDRLSQFFSDDQTYFAEFYQVVLDEGLRVIEESTGLMWLSRPNRFRWEYREPFLQTVVGDGVNIWVYDAELQQTTVNSFSDVVDRSAALVLSGFEDFKKDYTVEDLGVQGRLVWVSIKPKDQQLSQFKSMRMGFDETSLKAIEILDSLDNTTRLRLLDVVLNADFNDSVFQFEVPEGVDVIDGREQ